MNIILNNRPEAIEKNQLTVQELLEYKNFTFKLLVVKINNLLVKRDQYNTATISDGDYVTVLHLISGG
ncbi:MAG TPA: sulfur carrier protein ThiS [Bacteroidales bacterium]|nr:sulfur carrier protein ThiS [Bacteroidales bacterium]HRZ49296.1 sulfur carrier protein ThiS [Bacteroidales bacterium]